MSSNRGEESSGRRRSSAANGLRLERRGSADDKSASTEQSAVSMLFIDACQRRDQAAIRTLLKRCLSGAEPGAGGYNASQLVNALDNTGKTGLCHAASIGAAQFVQFLTTVPAIDPNLADNDGNTPLIFAAQAGHYEVVGVMIRGFPSLEFDKTNAHGFTALMKAAVQGRVKCAKMLLMAGASPSLRDEGRGLCALEWAEYCCRHQCAKTIAQFMLSSTVNSLTLPAVSAGASNLLRVAESCAKNDPGLQRRSLRKKRATSAKKLIFGVGVTGIGLATVDKEEECFQPSSNTAKKKGGTSRTMGELEELVRLSTVQSAAALDSDLTSHIQNTLQTAVKTSKRVGSFIRSRQVPKVEVTVTSMDDNCLVEHQHQSQTFLIRNSKEARRASTQPQPGGVSGSPRRQRQSQKQKSPRRKDSNNQQQGRSKTPDRP